MSLRGAEPLRRIARGADDRAAPGPARGRRTSEPPCDGSATTTAGAASGPATANRKTPYASFSGAQNGLLAHHTGPPVFSDSWAILHCEITRENPTVAGRQPRFLGPAARATARPSFRRSPDRWSPVAPAERPLIGRTLGQHELRDRLGRGGGLPCPACTVFGCSVRGHCPRVAMLPAPHEFRRAVFLVLAASVISPARRRV